MRNPGNRSLFKEICTAFIYEGRRNFITEVPWFSFAPQLPSWTLFLAVCAVGIGGTFQYGYNVSIINAPTQVKAHLLFTGLFPLWTQPRGQMCFCCDHSGNWSSSSSHMKESCSFPKGFMCICLWVPPVRAILCQTKVPNRPHKYLHY